MNKNEHAIDMAEPVHGHGFSEESSADASSVKLRTNVLLLGDHLGDLGMSDGLNYNTRISVGFLWVSIYTFRKDDNDNLVLCASYFNSYYSS